MQPTAEIAAWPRARGVPACQPFFHSPEELSGLTIRRELLWNNKKSETGPLDIIGDIHGCLDEVLELLASLGYSVSNEAGRYSVSHPQGRKVVFVGDLVDRGPNSPGVIRLVMGAVASGAAFCVAGNHDVKLSRALRGRDVKLTHGLAESMEQFKQESDEFRKVAADYLDGLVSHYVFDEGRLVVAHAGLREEMHGRGSGAVRQFAMYGETTGETDEYGLPVRYNWAADYRGKAMVVYGPHASSGCLSGSITPSASTPGACSAASSPLFVTPNGSLYQSRLAACTTSR